MEVAHVTGRIELDRVETEMLYKYSGLGDLTYEKGLTNPNHIFGIPESAT
jgi:hypothetical protein